MWTFAIRLGRGGCIAGAFATLLSAPVAGWAQAQQGSEIGMRPVCEVVGSEVADGMVQVQGRVEAKADAEGRYDFVLRKSDAAGSASMNQSGALVVGPDGQAVVDGVTLSLDEGGHIEAALTVTVGLDWASCRSRIDFESVFRP